MFIKNIIYQVHVHENNQKGIFVVLNRKIPFKSKNQYAII